jgi:hypothetical protein
MIKYMEIRAAWQVNKKLLRVVRLARLFPYKLRLSRPNTVPFDTSRKRLVVSEIPLVENVVHDSPYIILYTVSHMS